MRHYCFTLCLASLTICAAVGRTQASPIKLSVIGYAFDVPVNDTIDVSNGFSGTSLSLTSFPIGPVYGSIPEGGSKSINSSISLQATLFDSTHNLTSLTLSGPIQGSLRHSLGNPNADGSVQGSAMPGSLHIFPGVDPNSIPSWFSGLSASVSGNVTGGGENLLNSSLLLSPGVAISSDPLPVPEPTSLALFGLAAIAFGSRYVMIRRRKTSQRLAA